MNRGGPCRPWTDLDDFNFQHKKTDKFIIGLYGLLNHLRNPKNLWKTLNEICEQNPEFKEKLEIRLSGKIDTEVFTLIFFKMFFIYYGLNKPIWAKNRLKIIIKKPSHF